MHLVSLREQVVGIGEWVLEFGAGETDSHREFLPVPAGCVPEEAGSQASRIWTSDDPEFAIFVLKA
jgi:hypothetical protein